MVVNNSTTIQYGHYYLNLNVPRSTVSSVYTITLPTSMTYYCAIAIPRNCAEMDCGVIQPNFSQLQFQLHNNSAEPRNVYGVYWICVGF